MLHIEEANRCALRVIVGNFEKNIVDKMRAMPGYFTQAKFSVFQKGGNDEY